MKIKRAIAIMLACTLLAGQAVYAQETDKEETLQGEGQEVIEEEEKDVTEEKGEALEEETTEQTEDSGENYTINKTEQDKDIELTDTIVSDEDRWNLMGIGDIETIKGHYIDLSKGELPEEEELLIEPIENEGIIKVLDGRRIKGIKEGTTRLRVKYKNFSKEITVTVKGNGINYDQEVGERYTGKIELTIGEWRGDDGLTEVAAIRCENGELWIMYPEPEKVKENVKQCLIDIRYEEKAHKEQNILYDLDMDNILWNGEERLAEDVVKFDVYYALNNQNELKNLRTNEIIYDVNDWYIGPLGETLYVLKSDGSLEKREEDTENPGEAFEKVKDHVKQLRSTGRFSGMKVLCEDGTLYDCEDMETAIETGIDEFIDMPEGQGVGSAFYAKDGSLWAKGFSGNYDKYINLGNLNAISIMEKNLRYESNEFPYYQNQPTMLILTSTNEVYAYKKESGITKIDSNVKLLNQYSGILTWDYQKLDGEYYKIEDLQRKKLEMSKDEPLFLDGIWTGLYFTGEYYQTYCTGTEEDNIIVKKEGMGGYDPEIELLNHVDRIWRDHDRGYALRTDGTIWDITDVPKMILDLKTSTYVKGDVNEDGEVNIKDLQLILRGVCEKIKLTERQIMIADVVKDGKVDIQDLRKELRFVCGKITEL